MQTVIPSEYGDFLTSPDGDTRTLYRTGHLHVKVKGPERSTLTTQPYLPWNEGNSRDSYSIDELLLQVEDATADKIGCFDLCFDSQSGRAGKPPTRFARRASALV